jgi:Xaa-Pro dipeptidase
MTEMQVQGLLMQALFARGADELAFGPIVAAGDNSARPHAHARDDYAIAEGDALLFDFGARKSGFCADITRTVFVGHASDEAVQVYDTVLRANLRGHEIARAGVSAHDVDDAVTSVLEASPFGDRIRTKTGHGLGRDVHEAPYIMRGNPQLLEAGMVFTNEPGLYRIGAFGVRIEDDILVTDDGNISLTTFPKTLTIVG